MPISIIIPVFNEAENISLCVSSAYQPAGVEIIVVDGGSSDCSREIAAGLGARVISTGKSRAGQMNEGAGTAKGNILLFLHADTVLPHGYAMEVRRILEDESAAAGAFRLSIDAPGLSYRLLGAMANLRSRWFKMPYGDQAIFMRSETFSSIGGFPDLALMEDFELMRRIGKRGKVVLSRLQIRTSARRWKKLGIAKTTLLNQFIILAYLSGAAPEKLARLYGR